MPMEGLSEQERMRLAQLLKGPLIPPPDPPRTSMQWPKWNGDSMRVVKKRITDHGRGWAIGGAVGLGCLLLLAVELAGRRAGDTVKFEVRETEGRLQIRWDAESDLVRRATGAKLFITDGAERLFVNLDPNRLRRGRVSYARQSGRVELRLALAEPDGRTLEQQTVFLGAPREQEASQLSAAAQPAAAAPSSPVPVVQAKSTEPAAVIEHRSRRKPLVQSGTSLPFTCAAGDLFHKTDAPPGWDTFVCKGKNVWSVAPSQAGDNRPAQRPSATTLIAKPASTT